MSGHTLNQLVAEEIRALMARRRVSGVKIAKRLGHSNGYLSARLNSLVMFDLADLEIIADMLEVPVTAFFDRPVLSSSSSRSLREGVTNYSKFTPPMLTATLTSRYVTKCIDAPLGLAA